MNKKTESSLKVEKIIEKVINFNNKYEYVSMSPMGDDYGVEVKVKFDKKTDIDEIDDEFIEVHNKIHGFLNRIPYGTKYYGTVYLKVTEIKYFDEDGEIGHLSQTNPVFSSENEAPYEIFNDVQDVLEKWLGKDMIYFDIDFVR
jgi:hypothetical protein